jgi:hypothetical protein
MRILFVGALCLIATALLASSLRENVKSKTPVKHVAISVPASPVTVGTVGNEPIVTAAPDGTLYISALQHMYVSTNGGASWTPIVGPPESEQINLNSDSSISVDPGNRLYFTFDYPYAGTTAVCTTDDRGVNWFCNPGVVPGGTDRMWVVAPTTSAAYEVTNQGLYETAFLMSTDRGTTWLPEKIGDGVLQPQSGPLLQQHCSTRVVQPIKMSDLDVYVYDPASTGAILSDVRSTGLGVPIALPSGVFSLDGTLYVSSEEPNPAGGRQVVVARSSDEGLTWTRLPPIPTTATGTATFSWIAAGAPGHIGVLYYYTPDNGSDPINLTSSNWSAVWAESYDGDTANPTWTITTVENLVHTGAICIASGCSGTNRFAGDFITSTIDSSGAAHLAWMSDATGTATIRYARIQSGVVSTYVPPACGSTPLPVQLNTVVSRKVHGSAGPFDVNLPVTGNHGIECRSGGDTGDYTVVFRFADTLTGVGSARVSTGTGQVKDGAVGSDAHEYVVNLTGVGNAQHLFVTLRGVSDSTGHYSDAIAAPMSVLIGDVNATARVDAADVSEVRQKTLQPIDSSNFRDDVNASGRIDAADVSVVRQQTLTTLP